MAFWKRSKEKPKKERRVSVREEDLERILKNWTKFIKMDCPKCQKGRWTYQGCPDYGDVESTRVSCYNCGDIYTMREVREREGYQSRRKTRDNSRRNSRRKNR